MAAVLFYETENGSVPVQEFIESLPAKHGAKVYWEIGLLETYGTGLKEPYVKPIRGERYKGLWELRIQFAGDISRVFYFTAAADTFILLHGFVKKTAKTPRKELETTLARKADYQRRCP